MNHPIALITYNRPHHLMRVIDGLRPQEPKTIYVFSDGPKDDVDMMAVLQTRQAARTIDWTSIITLERMKNLGLGESIVKATDLILRQYETVIVLEDDCVPGPHFMEFITECLDRYKDDPKVLCCTGYTVNIPQELKANHSWDCYFFPRTETWGWATWRHKWKLYRHDLEAAYQEALNKRVNLEEGGPDIPGIIEDKLAGVSKSWSPGWLLAAYLNEMVCVFPTISHIQNIGFDGSGVHCGMSDRWMTEIAQERPWRFPRKAVKNDDIAQWVWDYHGR